LAFHTLHKPFLILLSYATPVIINSFLLIDAFFKKRRYIHYFIALKVVLLFNSWLGVQVLQQFASIHIYFIQHLFNTAGFILIATFLEFYRQNVQQRIAFQEMQAQQRQSELNLLKSQIHPHFLFNTLNSIYSLALEQSEKAAEVVLKLSDLMRYMLHQSAAQFVPLAQEVEYLRNYLWLEKLRLGNRADIQLQVKGNLNQAIAPMLFLPFIENTFKHGVDQLSQQVFVRINIETDAQGLTFRIENNKPVALTASDKPGNPGTGLPNVQRRLSLLYPNRHTLKLEEIAEIYRVCLQIYWK
jgi:LytS/YehU family sensor histidine kinase